MPEPEFDPEDYEGLQEKMATVPRAQVRRWERQSRELEEARAALARLERERTFDAAGVPADNEIGKLFRAAYDGELTVEAVKSRWEAVAPPSAAPSGTSDAALAAHARMADAAAGAQPANPAANIEAELAAIREKYDNPEGWSALGRSGKGAQAVAQLMHRAGFEVEHNKPSYHFGR